MRKTRICVISICSLPLFDESYNQEKVVGGAEVNMYQLALCFSEMENIELKVLVGDYGQPPVIRKNNVELIRLDAVGMKNKSTRFRVPGIDLIRQLMSLNDDMFIFTCSDALLGKLVLLLQIMKRKKVVFRLSSDLNLDLESFRSRNGFKAYMLYKFGLKHAYAIVSQTQKQRLTLEEKFGIKSQVIENGFFIRPDINVREKKHILWVGRCLKTKRPLLFIELARCMPEEEFVMIMPVNKESALGHAEELEMLADEVYEQAKSVKNLTLIDYVAYNNIQDYYDKAKVYVTTSELEGFPNTLIQACLGGTPVLSYRINPDHMIDNYALGCVCNDNVSEAVSFIKGISDGLLEQYKERMISYVQKHHNIHDTAQKYLALLDKGQGGET